jgi:hypothetical protein
LERGAIFERGTWHQIPRAPKPDDRTDPADLPDFDDDPYETPDEVEEEFDVNAIGERWWP